MDAQAKQFCFRCLHLLLTGHDAAAFGETENAEGESTVEKIKIMAKKSKAKKSASKSTKRGGKKK